MISSSLRPIAAAYGRALLSQLTGKMLLLSVVPFLLSLALWGVLLWFGAQPLIDSLQQGFADHELFRASGSLLSGVGLGVLKTVVVPLLALLLLLPLTIVTALLFMGIAAMPAITRHVAARQFPALERKNGGSLAGSLRNNAGSFLLFVPLWLLTLPLYVFAPLALLAQALLWGWLTSRVMGYDALAEHASVAEREALMQMHRKPLLLIGVLSGAAGAIPGLVWIGGAAAIALFPILAALAVWLYVLIFIFTGLWFQYYCLQALAAQRAAETAVA